MTDRLKTAATVCGCCGIVFLPGSLIFGFPGIMAKYWMEAFSVGRAQVGQIMFFVLAAVGIFMFIIGRLQEKIGPRWLAVAGSLLCAGSVVMVGRAEEMTGVYLWAFLTGAASAFLYLPALTVAQLWVPHRRGLVSGLVNTAFALSAAIMSPIYIALLDRLNYPRLTLIIGGAVLIIGLTAAMAVRFPSAARAVPEDTVNAVLPEVASMTLSQSLRTRSFWLLWTIWALAGAASIAMVTLSVPFGLFRGLTLSDAVLILTAFNLTNGLSRILSGLISDAIGRKKTMGIFFLAAGCAYLLMNHASGLWTWALLAAVIGLALGTLFSVSAPLVSDCFGMAHFGSIYGLVFTAYGFVAGALGPWLSGFLLDVTGGNYTIVMTYLGIFLIIAAFLLKPIAPQTECLYPSD
jgi:OFA family oxalate/formate antiporter-like MFS transporter